MKQKIHRKLNPELKVIRPGYEGALMIGNRFSNSLKVEKPLFWEIIRWRFAKNPQQDEKKSDRYYPYIDEKSNFLKSKKEMVVWLGHSSFYIRLGGITMIIDPIFYNLPFIPRRVDNACHPSMFKDIDYLLLSHDHRDHADKRSIKEIIKGSPNIKVWAPLGMSRWLKRLTPNIEEAAWWQQYKTLEGIEIFFLPAKHWSRRHLFDYNKVFWGSFMIRANGKTIYYAGDTGWCDHFAEIGKAFPNIDLALMPIGAYKPSYIMKREHISPHEAVTATNLLKAKSVIPMHYGTYDLADEPPGEPIYMFNINTNLRSQVVNASIGELIDIKKVIDSSLNYI